MSDWIKLATYSNRAEAELVRSILDENGINCAVRSDDLAGLAPGSRVDLWIGSLDLENSEKILEAFSKAGSSDTK